MGAAGATQVVLLARDVKPESTRVTPDVVLEYELDNEDDLDETLELDKEELERELELDVEILLTLEDKIRDEEEELKEAALKVELDEFDTVELIELLRTDGAVDEFELPPPEPPHAETIDAKSKHIIFI